MSTQSERVPVRDFEPEPCAKSNCDAQTSGECLYGNGTAICHHGPWRNVKQKVERRKRDRRAVPLCTADKIREAVERVRMEFGRAEAHFKNGHTFLPMSREYKRGAADAWATAIQQIDALLSDLLGDKL